MMILANQFSWDALGGQWHSLIESVGGPIPFWFGMVTSLLLLLLLMVSRRYCRQRPIGYGRCETEAPVLTPPEIDQSPKRFVHPARRSQVDTTDADALARELIAQGRMALLLRSQIASSLSDEVFELGVETLHETMSLVPAGEVTLNPTQGLIDAEKEGSPLVSPRTLRVDPIFLDRYPVTNAQYYEFVRAGGYTEAALWDPAVLPALLDFVDRTGAPGPRHWHDGTFHEDWADFPVVGVCWYEAAAYARWAGKRLPSDAEWVKAGAWPVRTSEGVLTQRRYPWGDMLQPGHANLWAGGPGRVVAVHEFSKGASVGGVYQLIGNVWEWTSSPYRGGIHGASMASELGGLPDGGDAFKSIRGGAFDSYFESHATCQFQSGEPPLSRRHNIGFRCAVGMCDLALRREKAPEPTEAEASAVIDAVQEELTSL